MAIVALFTAELFPIHKGRGSMLTDTFAALNGEIAAFLDGKVPLRRPIPRDSTNAVRIGKIFTQNPDYRGWVMNQGTVAVSIDLPDTDVDEVRKLAESFTSKDFPYVSVDILSSEEAGAVDLTKPYTPASVEKQIAEQIAEYGTAEEREARRRERAETKA